MSRPQPKFRVLHENGYIALQKREKFLGLFDCWVDCDAFKGTEMPSPQWILQTRHCTPESLVSTFKANSSKDKRIEYFD